VSSNTQTRSKHLLIAWLQTAQAVKQKELVAIARIGLDCKPSSSAQSCTFMIELMRASVRLGLRKKFPDELKVLTEVFDQALVKTYAQMHAEKMGPQEWWENFGDIAPHVMDATVAETILNETTSWTAVASELDAICSGSQVVYGNVCMYVCMYVYVYSHISVSLPLSLSPYTDIRSG
jgi:hypothetical protein